MIDATRDDYCAVAIAEAFRGDGEILASAIGPLPQLGAKLAKRTFEPGLLLTDGVATIVEEDGTPEGWLPYRKVFDVVWSGRRHVMMGATQIDQFGNQNISCIGAFAKPKVMLLGMRGAPGNTINHATSYWVPNHSPKVFVSAVDVVSGVGYDKAASLGDAGRFVEVRRVISNLGVFDFDTPERRMRVRSLHPGVELAEVVDNTGFELAIPDDVPTTRGPTQDELAILREIAG